MQIKVSWHTYPLENQASSQGTTNFQSTVYPSEILYKYASIYRCFLSFYYTHIGRRMNCSAYCFFHLTKYLGDPFRSGYIEILHSFKYAQYYTLWVSHNFFNPSSTNGHLDMANHGHENNVAVNNFVRQKVCICVSAYIRNFYKWDCWIETYEHLLFLETVPNCPLENLYQNALQSAIKRVAFSKHFMKIVSLIFLIYSGLIIKKWYLV